MVYVPQPYSYKYEPNCQQRSNQHNTNASQPQQESYSYTPTYSTSPNAYVPGRATSHVAATMPDFSQAFDVPPPTGQQTLHPVAPTTSSYGYLVSNNHKKSRNDNLGYGAGSPASSYSAPFAVAVPTQSFNNCATSSINSTNYSGGPTHGLVSEGNPTICQKLDYEIKGHEMQLVEIELDPSETVIAEAGAMMYMEEGIDFKTKFGDGSNPKPGFFKQLLQAGGRLLTGESLFLTHFSNTGRTKARVAFAAPYPGTIVPVNMANIGGTLICQKDAFLCAALGTKLTVHLNKRIGSGFFGGEGFILQKLKGDGMAFVHAGGMIIKRELRGEKLRLDTGCLVAFSEGIKFDVQFVPGLKSMIFGGEGLFLATLEGTGTVWLQSLPFSRFADRIIQHAPSIGGRRQDEGSALTGKVGDVFDGDGFGFPGGLGSLMALAR